MVLILQSDATMPLLGEYFVLTHSDWNDWWTWETLYEVTYHDTSGQRHLLGATKIAAEDAHMEGSSPALPKSFNFLGSTFFSLGQDESYYSDLIRLPNGLGRQFLIAIGDVVARPELFERYKASGAMTDSLLRYVSLSSVKGQYTRILNGIESTQPFELSYTEIARPPQLAAVSMRFAVSPGTLPPSNIHVLIGRNGSGKTRLLHRMADSLINQQPGESNGFIAGDGLSIEEAIAGVGHVSFSVFDRTPPLVETSGSRLKVFNVNLKKQRQHTSIGAESPLGIDLKGYKDVEQDMGRALYLCSTRSMQRWRHAVQMLESDPVFERINVENLAVGITADGLSDSAVQIFRELSSGHQIVLLTITNLVAHVEERTLILIDEPEGHLHPPLLSALIRAISNILSERNAFAIVATHSPVILQEVPSRCVHMVRRSEAGLVVDGPRIETFGENVGVLTREVFGLEVESSGFYRLISSVATESPANFSEIASRFDNRLGSEAVAQILAYLRTRDVTDEQIR